jgi:protein SCO1/2
VAILLAAVLAGSLGFYLSRQTYGRQTYGQPQSVGKVIRYGAPRAISSVDLTDMHGKPLSLEQLKGRMQVLFFGFTHCPDVCPNTLSLMAEVIEGMPKDSGIGFVFISVDPKRDSSKVLLDYVEYFSKSLLGATGEPAAIAALASELGVMYAEQALPGTSDYTIDHSANLFVLNSKAELVALIRPPLEAKALKADLMQLKGQWHE